MTQKDKELFRNTMTREELENLYEEVTDLIYDYRCYHVWYS